METNHHSWISLFNKFGGKTEASFLIKKWSLIFNKPLEEAKTLNDIHSAKTAADEATGIRSFPVEALLTPLCGDIKFDRAFLCCRLIAYIGISHEKPNFVDAMDKLAHVWPGADECLDWVIPANADESFDYYHWRFTRPYAQIQRPPIPQIKTDSITRDVYESCKTQSQYDALTKLNSIAEARITFKGRVGTVAIRPSALIVGLSASGKSWVAHQFAVTQGLNLFATTIAAWSPINSKSDTWTLPEILRRLEKGPLCIVIDELDKIRANAESQNWWRAVYSEILQLLDAQLQDINPSATALKNLKSSWILGVSAFQDLYRKKIGDEVLFLEQLENATLTYTDIAESGWLPDELLTRLSTYVEVKAPTVDEVSASMLEIEETCGLVIPKSHREGRARAAVMAMQGFRGLQQYALDCAEKSLDERKKLKKTLKKLDQEKLENPPDWF